MIINFLIIIQVKVMRRESKLKNGKRLLLRGIVLGAVICIIFLLGSYYAFRKTCFRDDYSGIGISEDATWNEYQTLCDAYHLLHAQNETVRINVEDGTELVGHFYEVSDDAPVIIFFPGYRGNYAVCGVPFYRAAKMLNWNILLVCNRASRESAGKYSTLGAMEKGDCKEWVEWTTQRLGNDCSIYLGGLSMGASYILQACDSLPTSNVRGIVSDCGFARPLDIIDGGTREKLPKCIPIQVWDTFLECGTRLYGDFSVKNLNATNAIQKTSIPILFLHSDTDELAPISEIESYCNSDIKKLVIIHGADHGENYITDPELYMEALVDFLKECQVR